MTIDLSSLRSELRDHLGVDDTDLPDTAADLLLNRSYWEILDKFPFREKEVTATFSTVSGTRFYKGPTPFEAIQQLSIEDLNSKQHDPLDHIDSYVYEQKYINRADAQAKPFAYLREQDAIRLYPTPDGIYTITIKYWTTLADLSSSNTSVPLPQSWHENLLFGAVWRGHLKNLDYARARSMRSFQGEVVIKPTDTKEKSDMHTAGLEVKGYDGAL